MYTKHLIVISLLILSSISKIDICSAGDLDDGISKYTDDKISADDQLGKPGTNLSFIIVDALSNVKSFKGKKEGYITNFNNGTGEKNENSIVLEPGTCQMGCDTIININGDF